jgi:predicted O-linked N-acetylglucosamine transferase (SPINDLY family)
MADLTVQQAFDLAIQHHQAGRLQEAEGVYRQIHSRYPEHVPTMYNLGTIAHQTGRHDIAVDLIRRVVAVKSDHAEAFCVLGDALREQGQLNEAIAACRRAIALRPSYAQAYFNLGNALYGKGLLDDAIAAYRQAVAFDPRVPENHANLAVALHDKGRFDEAIAAYDRAINIAPKFAKAYFNLGNSLRTTHRLDEASTVFEKAIALNPDYAQAYCNLGLTLKDKGEIDEAIAAFGRAAFLGDDPNTHSNLLFMPHYQPGYDEKALAQAHRAWSAKHAEPLRRFAVAHGNDRDPQRPLKIGYVSPDFRRHSVCYFFENLLAFHDQESVQTYCYFNSARGDATTERLRQHAGHWRDIVKMNDADLAELIRQDRIDILVDLSGHTAFHRLMAFAHKPAPIQVTYLGYPDTTGMSAIDYRLTDALADPPGQTEALYAEQLVRLPRTFLCYRPLDDAPAVGPSLVLSSGHITFGSFNALPKINVPLIKIWSRILHEVPDSRMILKNRGLASRSARRRLLALFAAQGIAPERIELLDPSIDEATHLQIYDRIDIALDTYPYHGTTTTCEAMWMGVPTVTLAGHVHASRVGVSILSNAGFADLIAQTPHDYVRIAAALADDKPRLAQIRSTIRQQMKLSPLMDAKQFARDVETAYRQMWHKWCSEQR